MFVYGMEVDGLAQANDLTDARHRPWVRVRLERHQGRAPERTRVAVGRDRAELDVAGYAGLTVVRQDLSVRLESPAPITDDEVVHPLLTFVASVVARWQGRSSFHSATVLLHGGAWVFLAPPGGGKSSLVSALHARGHAVVSEDLSIIDGTTVFAGPRTCDLRAAAAVHLERGTLVPAQEGRVRYRETLRPAPHESPLAGFVALSWGAELSCRRADVATKLQLLATNEALAEGPAQPDAFLRLLPLPMLELTRPRRWEELDTVLSRIEAETLG